MPILQWKSDTRFEYYLVDFDRDLDFADGGAAKIYYLVLHNNSNVKSFFKKNGL